jgi:hypothetical protein
MCKHSLRMVLGAAALAILTAGAPTAVLVGSNPAHADPPAEGHGGLIWTFGKDGPNIGDYHIGDVRARAYQYGTTVGGVC